MAIPNQYPKAYHSPPNKKEVKMITKEQLIEAMDLFIARIWKEDTSKSKLHLDCLDTFVENPDIFTECINKVLDKQDSIIVHKGDKGYDYLMALQSDKQPIVKKALTTDFKVGDEVLIDSVCKGIIVGISDSTYCVDTEEGIFEYDISYLFKTREETEASITNKGE